MCGGEFGSGVGFFLQSVARLGQTKRSQFAHGLCSLLVVSAGGGSVGRSQTNSDWCAPSPRDARSASIASTIAQYPSSQAIHIGYSVMAGLVPAIHVLL